MTCNYLHESGYTEDYDGAHYAVLYPSYIKSDSIVFSNGNKTVDVSDPTWKEMINEFGPINEGRWEIVNDWFIENGINGMGFLFHNQEDFLTFKLKWL